MFFLLFYFKGDFVHVQKSPYQQGRIRNIKFETKGFYINYRVPKYLLRGYEEWFEEYDLDTIRNPNSIIRVNALNLGRINSLSLIR